MSTDLEPACDDLVIKADRLRREIWCKHVGMAGSLIIMWLVCLTQLAHEWLHDPEYRHGWILPLSVIALIVMRWRQEPLDLKAERASTRIVVVLLSVCVLVMWFPVRLIAYANPDWHIMSWVTYLSALTLTLFLTHALGGMNAVRLFGLPFLMIAGAIPLPTIFETKLIAFLKEITASCTIEVLHAAGIAAFREARDLIALKHTVLGIEDGCTGIRSLHLCLAAVLFWSELHRLRFLGRFILVAAAACWAVSVNVLRSVALAVLAEHGGAEAFDQWHQLVGFAAQAVTLVTSGLALMWVLKSLGNRPQRRRHVAKRYVPGFARGGVVRLHGAVFFALACFLLVAELGRAAWFGRRVPEIPSSAWSFYVPQVIKGFREVPFPEERFEGMGPDVAFSGEWKDEWERVRLLHFLFWSDENPKARSAGGHLPEGCLPPLGFELKESPEYLRYTIGDAELAFRRYQFVKGGEDVIIYHGVWTAAGVNVSLSRYSLGDRRERLAKAWRGHDVNLGCRIMEVGFWSSSVEEADKEMEAFLHATLVPHEKEEDE